MGLFDKGASTNDSVASRAARFTSMLAGEVDNVPQALKDIAAKYNLKTSQIDFSVHSTQTMVKLPENDKPTELTPQLIGRISDESLLTQSDFYIRQLHRITFRAAIENNIQLDFEVAANASKTRSIATVRPTSRIHNFTNLREFVIEEINKLKLRYGMIINLRESTMINDIGLLVNKIRIHNKVPEPVRITLCDWVAPMPTINDDLIMHYQNKNAKAPKETDRIDYADRGFIKTAEVGELLVEYIKPLIGRSGRDFRGVYIPALKPRVSYSPILDPDLETIDVRETDRAITYYAKRQGYVTYRRLESRLYINDTLEVASVDFKTTGDIKAGIDRDVKILVVGTDPNEDNIGTNTKIEASEIDITGSIASGAQVRTDKLRVGGQTHAASTIIANEATIAIHRGKLDARKVKIDLLELGKVNAEEVVIDRMMGGIVWARTITIGALHSHATLIASEKIEITQLVGGENRLYIEAAATTQDRAYFLSLFNRQKECEKLIFELAKKYTQKRDMLMRNKPQMDQVRERIDGDKISGRMPPSIFVERYRQYLDEVKNAKTQHDELEILRTRASALQDEIALIQNKVMSAVVINRDMWHNYNEIRFRLLAPPQDVLFVPKEHQRASKITLKQTGLEEFAVKVTE